ITLVHLAMKAFHPGKIPFRLLHIDTGHNFPETLSFRDNLVQDLGLKIIVKDVEETMKTQGLDDESGKYASRNGLQSYALLEAIEEYQFDACIGGARRDEEKARAKERIFSIRDDFGQWDTKRQRPELFDMLNGTINPGENVRVFPISNWTELDVWNYIKREQLEIPTIYFSHTREVFDRDGLIWPLSPFVNMGEDEMTYESSVRFRTVGDMTCTAAVASDADNLDDIIREIAACALSERGARIDDKRSEAAMELRKQNGYF
ncbi:MAG: sulfate adenylyltransferase subunit 2, partial [Flavobacteriales bacterium]|nr:sulfate adenylyltransferase subunit 2 [Flavobacteriales bacterium]